MVQSIATMNAADNTPDDSTIDGPREALLRAAFDTVLERGLADLSLRALAEEIGSSHRMLLYHFGSREGLVAEIVRRLDAELYAVAWPRAEASADDPAGASRAVWREVTAPERRDEWILQFELSVAAMRGRPGTERLLESMSDWVGASESLAGWLGPDAHRQSRLLAAVVRGLLLDLLLTGDRDGVDDAFERFLELATR
jgi:AcrR family transcriptional regulator